MGTGIKAHAAGIGVLACSLSVQYRSIPVLDLGNLIPVPDRRSIAHRVLHSSVGYSIAQ
jgi:hypothetical protein